VTLNQLVEAGGEKAPASAATPAATFLHQATPGTTYWRCALPAKYLPGKLLPATELSMSKTGAGEDDIAFDGVEGGCAVIQFPGDNGAAIITTAFRHFGMRMLVEVDDNYLDYSDHLWHRRAGWGRNIGDSPHTIEGHTWIVEHAAGVIVTTPELRDAYLQHNDNVYVCRNSIDPDDWPELDKPDDGIFRIGWYASQSHDRDASMIRRAMSWASRQEGVLVVNLGLNPTGWDFTRYWHGWEEDFFVLRPELYKLDVGVAPLTATPMTKFRSDVKALEYAMGGAMPFVQGMRPYDEWLDSPFAKTCWTEKDWENAIRWAVKNQDEVRERGMQAREYVLRERTFATEIERWREAVDAR
jgi:hypothetical protein